MDAIQFKGISDALLTEKSVEYATGIIGAFDPDNHDPIEHTGEMLKVSRDFKNGFRAAEIYFQVKDSLIKEMADTIKTTLLKDQVLKIVRQTFEEKKEDNILAQVIRGVVEKSK